MGIIRSITALIIGLGVGVIGHEMGFIPGFTELAGLNRESDDADTADFVDFEESLYVSADWADPDNDCQDTRTEMMLAFGLDVVTTEDKCTVLSGTWRDNFTGRTITDPNDVTIVHVVPLFETHYSGAYGWDSERRKAYANHFQPSEAIALMRPKVPLNSTVLIAANDPRAGLGITDWLPEDPQIACDYAQRWVTVKGVWGLNINAPEQDQVEKLLRRCAS